MNARDSIFGFLKKLARYTRPEILFIFQSTESAASFLEEVSVLDVAALIASGRLKCVLESDHEMTLRLVKSDGSGGLPVLGASFSAVHNLSLLSTH